jgi:NitT/TauT family transport system substrate-binding protein
MIEQNDKIADVLTRYPFLKEKLIAKSPKFKNLNNPVVFNTVGKFARITDVAKVSGENLENLLHFLNEEIRIQNQYKSFT